MIRRYRSTCEGCALVPLVTSSIGDSELIIHFQEAYARLFPNCYNKQGIQSNLPSYTPMNQGTICAKVYPGGIQPIKGNNCRLIPQLSSSASSLGLFRCVAQRAKQNKAKSLTSHASSCLVHAITQVLHHEFGHFVKGHKEAPSKKD